MTSAATSAPPENPSGSRPRLVAIVRVALPVAADQLFDYWSPSGLEIQKGSVLRVRLGRRRLLGIAVDRIEASDVAPERVAAVDEVVTALPPLPADLCALAAFVSEYYQQPIGQCFAQLLPPLGSNVGARQPLAERYRFTVAGHAVLARHAETRSLRLRQLQSAFCAPEGAATEEVRRFGAHAWRTFGLWRKQRFVEPMPAAKTVSKLPVVRRDIAVLVDEDTSAGSVMEALLEAKPIHVEEIALFDVYRGPAISLGKKSLAILVLMQDTARTLTDAEIDGTVAGLLRVLQDRFGATLRQ